MAYLTETEITTYASIPGITMQDVITASELIDAYKGQTFLETVYVEQPKLTKKRQSGCYVFKGKLKHTPRIAIMEIAADIPSPFGGIQKQSYDVSCLSFDEDDYGYFTFIPQLTLQSSPFAAMPPSIIKVKYSAGYQQVKIPEALKVATGIMCNNAKQSGGFRSFKSRQDFDMSISFSEKEDTILSSNVIRLIGSVKLT